MKDYFALLTKPRNFQIPQETEPSLPSIVPFDGNDGFHLSGFQKITAYSTAEANAPKDRAKSCERCFAPMRNIEAGYWSCLQCHFQIVEAHSGFWFSQQARDEYDERAAIMEFDGGLSRTQAEELALVVLQQSEASPEEGVNQ